MQTEPRLSRNNSVIDPSADVSTKTTSWWKRWVPAHISIVYKLAAVLTLLISSCMVLLGLLIVSNQSELIRKQIHDFGQTMVGQLAESSKELVLSDDILSLMVVVNNLSKNENILGAVVYSHKGEIMAHSGRLPIHDIIKLYNRASSINERSYSVDWSDYTKEGKQIDLVSFITPIHYQKTIAGHALVTYNKTELSQALHDTVRAIVAATLFMIVLGIITAYFIGKRLTRPIHNLMDASRAIHNGNYAFRIDERRNDEIGYLITAFNSMANGLLQKHQVENAFSRFVSSKVAKQIMENLDQIQLGGKRVNATALFADIVGFTSLSEKLPAEDIASMLNEYFSYIDSASRLNHGSIDKYMGDCAMVVFGAPETDPEHKFNAIACAVMIQRIVERLNVERAGKGLYQVNFRIGINSGEMLAGNLGSHDRMQYTVVGEAVNLASRLHAVAERGQIVVTDYLINDPEIATRVIAVPHQAIRLRGIAEPVTTYVITDLNTASNAQVERQINEIFQMRKTA